MLHEDITLRKDITVGNLLKLLEQVAKAAAGRFPAARFAPVFAQLQARNPEECYDSARV